MATIPTDFLNATDVVLEEQIQSLWKEVVDKKGDINTVMGITPLIGTLQQEYLRRLIFKLELIQTHMSSTVIMLSDETSELKKATIRAFESADRYNRFTIWLTVATIILSLIAVAFSYNANNSDKVWKKEEIDALNNIVKHLDNKVGVWKLP